MAGAGERGARRSNRKHPSMHEAEHERKGPPRLLRPLVILALFGLTLVAGFSEWAHKLEYWGARVEASLDAVDPFTVADALFDEGYCGYYLGPRPFTGHVSCQPPHLAVGELDNSCVSADEPLCVFEAVVGKVVILPAAALANAFAPALRQGWIAGVLVVLAYVPALVIAFGGVLAWALDIADEHRWWRLWTVLLFPFYCAMWFGFTLFLALLFLLALKYLLLGLVLVFDKAVGFLLWIEAVGFGAVHVLINMRHIYHEGLEARDALRELKKGLAGVLSLRR
jgi:hypothetical protein